MCSALADVRYGPIADIEAFQTNSDLCELAGPCINFDCACVLFHDDVVANIESPRPVPSPVGLVVKNGSSFPSHQAQYRSRYREF